MWDSSGLSISSLSQDFSYQVLTAYGAKLNELIRVNHEWWRFVTPMFLHVNLLHLLVNMYSLWMIGPFVEKLYGSAKFVVFWVLTGIAGVVASYLTVRPSLATGSLSRFLFKIHDDPSAGASGALFGLVGVLFVFGIKFRHELPEGFKRAFGTGLLPIIMINLFIGFVGRGWIDNAAHLGGLFAGAALALAVDYRRPGQSHGSALVWRVLQIACLSLVALSFFKVIQHFHTARPTQVTQVQNFNFYANVMNQAQDTAAAVVYDHDYSNYLMILQVLDLTVAPDAKAEELKQRLRKFIEKAALKVTASPSPGVGPRPAPPPDKELVEEYQKWRADYDAWLKTAAPKTDQ
jgi:membrane associated rhomboid family serine protease